MPVADGGRRFPFFVGFSSRAEYLAAVRRLQDFLRRLAAGESLHEPDERLAFDFPSQRALRAATRRLAQDLSPVCSTDGARWIRQVTVAVRN